MSIDITIKQPLFGGKTVPLDVILGENLAYGSSYDNCLIPGQLGETEFLAYNPRSIGRGFSVVWNENEKKKIHLRLLTPTTAQELADFYGAVERIVRHWSGKLFVDGMRLNLDVFLSSLDDYTAFNSRALKNMCQQILDGSHDSWTMFSVMWPMTLGQEEAARFVEDPAAFDLWLHEKQRVSATYLNPVFCRDEAGIYGRYVLENGITYIFPTQPSVPFGTLDENSQPLQCEDWFVMLGIPEEDRALIQLPFEEFLAKLPPEKQLRFDGGAIVIPAMTAEELIALSETL